MFVLVAGVVFRLGLGIRIGTGCQNSGIHAQGGGERGILGSRHSGKRTRESQIDRLQADNLAILGPCFIEAASELRQLRAGALDAFPRLFEVDESRFVPGSVIAGRYRVGGSSKV